MSLLDSLNAAQSLKPKSKNAPSLENITTGNSFEFEGKTYLVKDEFTYTEYKKKKKKYGDSWSELEVFCVETGETKYMEVEVDDSVVVYFTDEVKLKLRDVGVKNEDHLDELVDEEDDVAGYYYEDDYYAVFKRDGTTEEPLWIVEYEKGKNWLCIEGWEGDIDEYSFEVSKGRIVPGNKFKVIS